MAATTGTSRSTRTMVGALAAAAVLAGGAPVDGGALVTGQAEACSEPYPAVYGYRAAPSGGPVTQIWPEAPVVAPAFGVSPFDHQQRLVDAGFDADGDGRTDAAFVEQAAEGGDVLVVARGDGEIRISAPGHALGSLQGYPVGDLDADGRDEILFLARPIEGGPDRNFVLPGDTAPGAYEAGAAGIAVPGYQVTPVGDRVGGPGDDLAVAMPGPAPRTAVVSGDDLMAAGPGGTADFDPSGEPLAGYPVGAFDLDDGEITLVTITDGTVGPAVVTLAVHRGGEITRFAGPAGLPLPQPPYRVSIVEDGGRRFLVAGHSDRGGSQGFYWDVDQPCRPLQRAAGGPTGESPAERPGGPSAGPRPPAARPVPGSPNFTG